VESTGKKVVEINRYQWQKHRRGCLSCLWLLEFRFSQGQGLLSVANKPDRLSDPAETDRDCGAYPTLVGRAVLTPGDIIEHGLYRALDGWIPERVTEG
jgi:hypothetical protein